MSQANATTDHTAAHASLREPLRTQLLSGGIPESHVDLVVDRAIGAALAARQALLDHLEREADSRVAITAFGVALDLAGHLVGQLRLDMISAAAAAGRPIKIIF